MNKKIEDNSDFVKTPNGAVVNTNTAEYRRFIERQTNKKRLENRVESLEAKLDLILEKLNG